MVGSIKIAAIRGIPIRAHITLLAVFVLLTLEIGVLGIPAGLLLFASVLAHELGHALVAQRFGIGIAGIDLHLLGGTAVMRGVPSIPKQEIAIALAGPAVSLALGLLFLGATPLVGAELRLDRPGLADLVPYLAAVNLAMAVFNLIPALPMDGGRVLRASLALKMEALRATKIAAWLARAFAVAFVGVGLFYGAWTLPLIGVVIFVLSGYELKLVQAREQQRAEDEAAAAAAPVVVWDAPPLARPLGVEPSALPAPKLAPWPRRAPRGFGVRLRRVIVVTMRLP